MFLCNVKEPWLNLEALSIWFLGQRFSSLTRIEAIFVLCSFTLLSIDTGPGIFLIID